MNITHWIQKKIEEQKGFTLLFAVLVSTLIVGISATVASIAVRQTILSSTSRESQYAFYAANTVLECAFYWDVIGTGESTDGVVFPYDGGVGDPLTQTGLADTTSVRCAGGNITTGADFESVYAKRVWSQAGNTTTFRMEIADFTGIRGHKFCAEATVTKDVADGTIITRIEAKGYNTCDTDNPRTVERGLVQSY